MAEFDITEPDEGQNVTVRVCFSAQVAVALGREALFGFLNVSTSMEMASPDYDFVYGFSPHFLIIPANLTGTFQKCVNFIVLGDDMVEPDEVIARDIAPLNPLDRVEYPSGSNSLRIYIADNDGKEKKQKLFRMRSLHVYNYNYAVLVVLHDIGLKMGVALLVDLGWSIHNSLVLRV